GFVQRFFRWRADVFGSLHEHRRERSDGRGREAQAVGARGGGGPGDRFIDVEISDEFFLDIIGEVLAPFGGAGESVFFTIPAADHDGAARTDVTLFEFAKRTRELHHRRSATGRIHSAESPRVTMIAEQHPFVGNFTAANARFDNRVGPHASVHVHFHVNFYRAGESIPDGQSTLPIP